jgi:hypothetical protein
LTILFKPPQLLSTAAASKKIAKVLRFFITIWLFV